MIIIINLVSASCKFIMKLLVYLTLGILLKSTTGKSCCPQKTVGGVAYQLVEDVEDTSKFGCSENCVYTRDGDGDRFCFKEGVGAVQCFENVTACTDSSNCKPGEECDLVTHSCVKGEL